MNRQLQKIGQSCSNAVFVSFSFSDIHSDLKSLKESNPDLRLLISLGGSAIKDVTFSNLITDSDRLANLTSSINDLYRDDVIQGIEIDWEWPMRTGDKKDRIKLIRYARVSWSWKTLGRLYPDRSFYNFRASKLVDRRF